MNTDFGTLSFQLAIFFLIVFALMIAFIFFIKRIKGGSFAMGKYPVMKNIASLSLGPKRSLALIEVCDQWILIGVGSDSISLISKIDKPSDISQFGKGLPQEANIFDSFLFKAGLKHKGSEGSSEKNE